MNKENKKAKIKRGSEVIVISGSNKGKRGKVLELLRKKSQVIVEKVAMKKKHQKPSNDNPQGGIMEREGPLHISNVMLVERYEQKKS